MMPDQTPLPTTAGDLSFVVDAPEVVVNDTTYHIGDDTPATYIRAGSAIIGSVVVVR